MENYGMVLKISYFVIYSARNMNETHTPAHKNVQVYLCYPVKVNVKPIHCSACLISVPILAISK
jgi:hypothetical protein